jgi:hypothetical protein
VGGWRSSFDSSVPLLVGATSKGNLDQVRLGIQSTCQNKVRRKRYYMLRKKKQGYTFISKSLLNWNGKSLLLSASFLQPCILIARPFWYVYIYNINVRISSGFCRSGNPPIHPSSLTNNTTTQREILSPRMLGNQSVHLCCRPTPLNVGEISLRDGRFLYTHKTLSVCDGIRDIDYIFPPPTWKQAGRWK